MTKAFFWQIPIVEAVSFVHKFSGLTSIEKMRSDVDIWGYVEPDAESMYIVFELNGKIYKQDIAPAEYGHDAYERKSLIEEKIGEEIEQFFIGAKS